VASFTSACRWWEVVKYAELVIKSYYCNNKNGQIIVILQIAYYKNCQIIAILQIYKIPLLGNFAIIKNGQIIATSHHLQAE
jgi:hypothetical protein